LSWLFIATVLAAALLLVAYVLARQIPWRVEAHRGRALDGSPVSQFEFRVARREGAARSWRLYCSIVLARGQDRPLETITSGQPPASRL
jgi:hypothetical protein